MNRRQALPTSSAQHPAGTLRYWIIGGGALVMMGLLLAAPAFACTPSAAVAMNPTSAQAGSVAHVFGSAFVPGESVAVRWGSGGPVLATATVDATGAFATAITVPAGATAGSYAIAVVGTARTAASHFAVLAAPAQPVDQTPAEAPESSQPAPVAGSEEPATPTEPAIQPVAPPNGAFEQEPVAEAPPVTQPVETPAPPVTEQAPAPAPVPAAETQTPAPAAPAPSTTTPVPAALTNTTGSPATTSTTSTPSTPAGVAPISEPAPEGEPVEVATTAYSPSTAERALLAGAGITAAQTAPEEAVTTPVQPADPDAVDAAPFASDVGESTPFDDGQGATPWALVPLMVLAGGLLTASGAALTTEARQRTKAKVKV